MSALQAQAPSVPTGDADVFAEYAPLVERMALAIYRQAWGTSADKRWHDDVRGRSHFIKQARAALQALRPRSFGDLPLDVCIAAEGAGAMNCAQAHDILAAMIDAILENDS